MSRIYRNLSAAVNMAHRTTGNIRHGAVLTIAGKIRARSFNNSDYHAEVNVLRSFLRHNNRKNHLKVQREKPVVSGDSLRYPFISEWRNEQF